MIAVPVVALVLAGSARALHAVLGPERGRGDRLIGEAALVGLGAFVLGGGVVLLSTFDASSVGPSRRAPRP